MDFSPANVGDARIRVAWLKRQGKDSQRRRGCLEQYAR